MTRVLNFLFRFIFCFSRAPTAKKVQAKKVNGKFSVVTEKRNTFKANSSLRYVQFGQREHFLREESWNPPRIPNPNPLLSWRPQTGGRTDGKMNSTCFVWKCPQKICKSDFWSLELARTSCRNPARKTGVPEKNPIKTNMILNNNIKKNLSILHKKVGI